MLRVGIDTGGTFTDCIVVDEASGRLALSKIPSTPADLSSGILAALSQATTEMDRSTSDVGFLVHGTTAATNAMLQRKTAKTALLTTDGFRDVLEIGTQMRPELYNLFQRKPEPLVPRHLRRGVPERIGSRGEEVTVLDCKTARCIVEQLLDLNVESIAVSLLFSYANPVHERDLAELIRSLSESVYVVCSSEISPKFREYPRTSTTVINALIAPVVSRYLENLSGGLAALGIDHPPFIMQSNGGIMSAEAAAGTGAHHLFLSGPAGGLVGAAFVAVDAGHPNIVTLDMGGTSCDVGVVLDGMPREVSQLTVLDHYPLEVTALDLHTIGAGGGSIAWIDSGGSLRAGPQSAGAEPGPASYGRGGTEATVTDANLVLGRLSEDTPLAGSLRLDRGAARRAVQRIAKALDMSLEDAALGIITIANFNMIGALQIVLTRRGHDPRDFTLVPFGGAGPLHAAELAREIGVRTLLIPANPGLLSALGLLVTDLKHQYVRTMLSQVDWLDRADIEEAFDDLRQQGDRRLADDGVPAGRRQFLYGADVRYLGQEYTLTVPVDPTDPDLILGIVDRFHESHAYRYGQAAPGDPVELVHLRATAIGLTEPPPISLTGTDMEPRMPPAYTRRPVFFHEAGGFVDVPVYRREVISPGHEITGPAVIEQADSTTIIHPGDSLSVDRFRNLIVNVHEVE